MVKRTSLAGDGCPVARALDVIGDWWSMLIIRDALTGRRRFGEFQKNLGLAKNILSARLRMLVDEGILATVPASDGSAYQEYILTDKGRGVFPILVALRQWSEEFDAHPDGIETILVDRENREPVQKLQLRARDGRLLAAGDVELKLRASAKRTRHLLTVSASTPRRTATTLLCSPSAQAKMMRARSASACAVLRREARDISSARSASASPSGGNRRPIAILPKSWRVGQDRVDCESAQLQSRDTRA